MTPPRPAGPAASWVGQVFTVEVGPVAHGGHCVARHEGRVIFVRHGLPGERVSVRITEDGGGSFCRGDAVSIEQAAPDRVEPPCRFAGPGRCGGCDFQHVALSGQRALKATVVAEQLQRLAGVDRTVTVEALPSASNPPGTEGLRWRRRVRFALTPLGELGLRAHRSHEVVPVDDCLIGSIELVGAWERLASSGDDLVAVECATDDTHEVAVIGFRERPAPRSPGRRAAGSKNSRSQEQRRLVAEQLSGPQFLEYLVGGHRFRVRSSGFWQNHPPAAAKFTEVVLEGCQVRPGDRAVDLYAGAGLFTAALAERVGPDGAVFGIEGDRAAVEDARFNLAGWPAARMVHAPVGAATVRHAVDELGGVDVVVLDPPRAGAGREVMNALLDLKPRVIAYVACDPAALARDIRTALDAGWELVDLRAFDAFPMTHHVECIATLRSRPAPMAW